MKFTTFPRRLRSVVVLATLVAAITAAVALASPGEHGARGHDHAAKHKPVNQKVLALHDGMRKLWEDHITWTRLAIVSFAADLPDFDETAARLFQNQEDIGTAIEPFYGHQAAEQLTSLLKDHIAGAVDLLKAAKAGDDKKFAEAKDAWYRNGDEIARFLNAANPRHWPMEQMRSLMRAHLDQTLEEAAARLKGDFAADIRAYDEIHHHILMMADTLSAGIVGQFPHRFH
jgi:hypothetical protein